MPNDQGRGSAVRAFRGGITVATTPNSVDETPPTGVSVALPADLPGDAFGGPDAGIPAAWLPSGTLLAAGVGFAVPHGSAAFTRCTGQSVSVPAGRYSAAWLIGAAHEVADCVFAVSYTDGSRSEATVRFPDWRRPGPSDLTIGWDGSQALYLMSVPLDPHKETVSLTMPIENRARLLALTLQTAQPGVQVKVLGTGSTDLFVGPEQAPNQVVRVAVANIGAERVDSQDSIAVSASGQMETAAPAVIDNVDPGQVAVAELGMLPSGDVRPDDGTLVQAKIRAATAKSADTITSTLVVAEPGWTMHMVSHFHYDPVWWNTQAAFTESWLDSGAQHTGLALVKAHLDHARRDPDYKFVLAEVDYLKPYWDHSPEDRAFMRQLLREGRLEYVGGTYNEPSPVLTSAELTIRNVIYGVGYQGNILGGDPQSAWMLDVFGHDPQFPGICADAGLTSSSWARGPHHEWGPKHHVGDNTRMQFSSEFDWVAPSGRSLLTSYMPNHYSAGWRTDAAPDLESAIDSVYDLFHDLKLVAATKNVLLPVGTDYTPPNRWLTRIHREWARRYTWPKFEAAIARDFFDAVRREIDERGVVLSPQTRDMNPIFTGCYASYIDTKQAQREAENTLLAAEKFATIAAMLGARYPTEAIDKAWRQLCFGAHHDGITGSEADQVYVDLMGGWREAADLASSVLEAAHDHIATRATTNDRPGQPIVVFNSCSWAHTDVVAATVEFSQEQGVRGLGLAGPDGAQEPLLVEVVDRWPDETFRMAQVSFVATDVPATGYATYWLTPAEDAADGWVETSDTAIENEYYRVAVDPSRGGVITTMLDKTVGRDMLRPGRLGNELLAYDEYPESPEVGPGGGPWVSMPKGGAVGSSADRPAEVTVTTSPIGQRIVVRGWMPESEGYVQEITCWRGVNRIDIATHIDGFAGIDRMIRVRFAPAVEGGMPVSETAAATTGRTFGFPNGDYRDLEWTLDYPANNWVEVGTTLVVRLASGKQRSVSVAELVVPNPSTYNSSAHDVVVALVRRGVTATTSSADGSRYGALDADSNLPDFRISVGTPADNTFTKAVLDAADPAYAVELDRQLGERGEARVWVPATEELAQTWVPHADLRHPRALPVLLIALSSGHHESAMTRLARDLDAEPIIAVDQPAELDGADPGVVDDYGFALLNRGLHGFAVDVQGDLYLSLLRSSTGWPSGVWLDPPRRTLPDGTNFQTNHWSHTFSYSVVGHRGDWRSAGLVRHGEEFNNPLVARVVAPDAGVLPSRLACVEAAGDGVVVSAMKPRGNPIAAYTGANADPADGVVMRVRETSGEAASTTVRWFQPLRDASRVGILEQRELPVPVHDDAVALDLAGFEIDTVAVTPTGRAVVESPAELVPRTETVQPVFSQYWRHNTGAAPMGGQPVTVRVEPERLTGPGPFDLKITVGSEHTTAAQSGTLTLEVPPDWQVSAGPWAYSLAPGDWTTFSAIVTPPAGAAGQHFVAAQITLDDGSTHEAVAAVHVAAAATSAAGRALVMDPSTRKAQLVPEPLVGTATPQPVVTASWLTPGLIVRPGDCAKLALRLANPTGSEVRGEAFLITPFAMWPLTPQRTQGFAIPGAADVELTYDVVVPHDARTGTWWAMVKICYFGQRAYTATVPVTVTRDAVHLAAGPELVYAGQTVELGVDVTNLGDKAVTNELRVVGPEEWAVEVNPLGQLEPGASAEAVVKVSVPADASTGITWLRASLSGATTRIPLVVASDHVVLEAGDVTEAAVLIGADSSDGADDLANRCFTYRLRLPDDLMSAVATVEFRQQTRVEISRDGSSWTEVARGSSATVDVSRFGADGMCWLRVHLGRPTNGWRRLGQLALNLQRASR